jgi:hypothetical protein
MRHDGPALWLRRKAAQSARLLAGVPGLGLQNQELHAPDQAADAFPAGAGGTRKAAMLQPVGVPRLSATPPGRRKVLSTAED